ncbi:MAG TPA: adenylate/guanylate cyclase domain-containing protein [Desulfobacterales bacterium]|nr:adenylate/guanylate cyclase domain-containing protein [Desulfobacterales bacterium]
MISGHSSLALLNKQGSIIKTWPLTAKSSFRIGRGAENDIILANNWTSRQHAILQREENGLFNAIDLGSSNGTSINGQRIHTPTRLYSGDQIQIGSRTTLTFMQEGVPEHQEIITEDDERTVAFLEKDQVTILICDIRDFTSLSEEIGDKNISQVLKLWTALIKTVIDRHQGSIDKFIGDAVMATWIGRGRLPENIRQALSCALELSHETLKLGKKVNLKKPLRIGAALNTGEAVVGNIGVEGGRDYTVIGDLVNVTFRLEELTGRTGKDVIIGAAAARELKTLSGSLAGDSYQVKGRKEPVKAYTADFCQLKRLL